MNLQKLLPSKMKAFLSSYFLYVSVFWGFYCSVSPHLCGLERPIFVDFAKPELTAFWTKCLIKSYGDLSAPDLNIYKWCDQKLSTVNSEDV